MGRFLVVLFASAVADVWLLVKMAEAWGFLPTVAGVVASSLIGFRLAQREGLRVLDKWRQAMVENRAPDEGVLSSLLVLGAGAALVVPGPISTMVGLLLLLPAVRRAAGRVVQRSFEAGVRSGAVRVVSVHTTSGMVDDPWAAKDVEIIDTQGEALPPDPPQLTR